MDCDKCGFLLEEKALSGRTLHQCSIAKCPLLIRNEVLEEAASSFEKTSGEMRTETFAAYLREMKVWRTKCL